MNKTEICIGAAKFRDDILDNLREQIKNLREALSKYEEADTIYTKQYKHLIEDRLET